MWGSRGVEGLVVKGMWSAVLQHCLLAYPLADLGGALARAPYGPKFSQFHTVCFENSSKLYVSAPHVGVPSDGNPRSTRDI